MAMLKVNKSFIQWLNDLPHALHFLRCDLYIQAARSSFACSLKDLLSERSQPALRATGLEPHPFILQIRKTKQCFIETSM